VTGSKLEEYGPVLITHWGLSGPGVLRLSAWGARELANKDYRFEIQINWNGQHLESTFNELNERRHQQPKQICTNDRQYDLPKRLWQRLVAAAGLSAQQSWAETSKTQLRALAAELSQGRFHVNGKSTFKEEFVTCGGVDLKDVNFKTMESKQQPGLFFAGEMLDIDAITGGFNFQAAWTTSWIAAHAMADHTENQHPV